MATNIGTAFFNVTFNTTAARREVTAFVSNVNRNFGLLGGAALIGATTAIAGLVRATVGIGEAALQASIDYEQAFASVRKTVDDGTLSASEAATTFGRLNEQLRGLALEVPLDLEEDIANVAALGGQLGIPANQLTEFTRIIGEMGVTTNVTVEDAATSFARLANIMGLSEEDFRNLGDTVVNLGNKLPAQEDEILRFANRIAAAGEISGFTADEVLAVGAAMASVGVPSERGGTAIQRTWIKITDAVANGGEILNLISQVSGVTSEQFVEHWSTDAAGAWTLFVEGLGRAGTDAFRILRDLGLNDQRVIQSLLSIANAGDLMRTTFGFAADDMGALATESEIFFNTTEGQMQLLENRLHDVSITVGDEMKPAFRDILQTINDWIAENPQLIDQLGRELRGALEEVGRLLGDVLPIAEDILDLLPDLTRETAAWAGPLIEVAGGIIEVGNAFVTLKSQIGEGGEGLTGGLNVLTDFLTTGALQGSFETFDKIEAIFDLATQKAPDPEQWNIFWRAFFPPTAVAGALLQGVRSIGDEAAGAALAAQQDAVRRLQAGEAPMKVVLDSLISLQEELGPDAQIPPGFFGGILQESELTQESIFDLIHLAKLAGVNLPSIGALLDPTIARRSGPRGGGGAGVSGAKTAAQIALEDAEALADADAELEAIEKARTAAFEALTGAAEAYGISIDTVIDNYERLAPAAAFAMESLDIEGLGEATIRADLFGQSLDNLKNIIDFRPATEGLFGVGDIINGIEQVKRTLEGTDKEVLVRADDFARQAKKNLDQIARFEANLVILFARGQETLARLLAEQGPEAGLIASDFVSNFGEAASLEAALVGGGVIPDELAESLDEALAGKDVPQGLLDFVAQLGSNQVQKSVYDQGYASGQQYAGGWRQGFLENMGWLVGFLGLQPFAGVGVRTPPSGILDRGPLPGPQIPPPPNPGGGSGTIVNQNFYTNPAPTPQTQQAMQQAAAIIGYTG